MSTSRIVWCRRKSPSRQAFERAGAGLGASIGQKAFPENVEATRDSKVSRSLKAGGDMNPPWVLLDAVLELEPGVVLAELAAAHGFKVERLPEPEAASLERLAGDVAELLDRATAIGEDLAELRRTRMRKVEPGGRGRAAG